MKIFRRPDFISVAAFALFATAALGAGELIPFERAPFANAWLVPDETAERVNINLIFPFGEADNPGTEGMAHYVEHLASLNARAGNAADFAQHSNASTSHGMTYYWLSGPPQETDAMIARLSRVSDAIELDESFMEQERDIVLREYDYRIIENPYADLFDDLNRRLHGDDALVRSVIGSVEDIASFSLQEARVLHAATHSLQNAILLVYGNPAHEEVAALLAPGPDRSPPLAPSLLAPSPLTYVMGPKELDVVTVEVDGIAQPRVFYRKVVQLDAPANIAALTVELDLLWGVLDSRLPGGITKALQFDDFIAQNYKMSLDILDDRHLELAFYASPDRGITLEMLRQSFEDALTATAEAGIPEDTFARVRTRALAYYENMDDDKPGYALDDAFALIALRQDPRDFDQFVADLAAVDRARLNALVATLAGPGRTVVTFTLPTNSEE